jgi:hypothetical protein
MCVKCKTGWQVQPVCRHDVHCIRSFAYVGVFVLHVVHVRLGVLSLTSAELDSCRLAAKLDQCQAAVTGVEEGTAACCGNPGLAGSSGNMIVWCDWNCVAAPQAVVC